MKVGVIGLGSIGMRHAVNLKALGHEVIGWDPVVCDTPIENAIYEKAPHREYVLSNSDAIVIASPTKQHWDDWKAAAPTGKPILIEKPVFDGRNTHAMDKCWVGYNLRFAHVVQQAKRLLTEGLIGRPLWAKVTVGQYTDKEPYLRDGVTLNWSHEVDLALFLLGPGKVVTAVIDKADTIADIFIRHNSGANSLVHMDYVTKPEIRATTIVGTEGHITIDLVARWGCLIHKDGRQETKQFEDSWDDNYKSEIAEFMIAAEGGPALRLCTAKEAMAVLEICLVAKKKAGL